MTRATGASSPGSAASAAEAGVADRDRGRADRRASSRRRAPPAAPSGSPASRSPGSPTPTRTPSIARCAAAPQPAAGSFWTWREAMYELAAALDPDSYLRARPGDLRRDGARRDHRRRRVPLPAPRPGGDAVRRPERDRPGADRGGARGRDPDHAARRLLPARRLRRAARARASGASATATPSAGPSGSRRSATSARARGSAPRSTASAPSTRDAAATVADWAASAAAAARPRLRAAGRERGLPRGATARTPDRACSPTPARSAERFTAVHFTHVDRRRHRRCSASAARDCCLCPTTERDLADGIGPARRDRRRGRRASRSAPTRTRSSTSSRRCARSSSTSGWRPASAATTAPRRCSARRPRDGHAALGWPEAGGSSPARSPTWSTVGLDGVRLAGTDAETRARGAGLRGDRGRRARRDRRRARWSSRDGAHLGIDVAARARAAVVADGGGRDEPRSSIDNIGLLVTNDPELGEGPLGIVSDAALVIEDGRVAAVERGGRRRPTSGSTPAGAA